MRVNRYTNFVPAIIAAGLWIACSAACGGEDTPATGTVSGVVTGEARAR